MIEHECYITYVGYFKRMEKETIHLGGHKLKFDRIRVIDDDVCSDCTHYIDFILYFYLHNGYYIIDKHIQYKICISYSTNYDTENNHPVLRKLLEKYNIINMDELINDINKL